MCCCISLGLVCVACKATDKCPEDCGLRDVMTKVRADFAWLKGEEAPELNGEVPFRDSELENLKLENWRSWKVEIRNVG